MKTRWQKLNNSYKNKPGKHYTQYFTDYTNFYHSLIKHLTADDVTDLYNNDLGFDDPFDSTPDRTCILNDLAHSIQQLQPPHYRLFLIMLASGYSRSDITQKCNVTATSVTTAIKIAKAKILQIVGKQYKIGTYSKHDWEILTPQDDYTP